MNALERLDEGGRVSGWKGENCIVEGQLLTVKTKHWFRALAGFSGRISGWLKQDIWGWRQWEPVWQFDGLLLVKAFNLCPLIGHWISRTFENLLGLSCQAEWLWWQWPQPWGRRLVTIQASDWSGWLDEALWLADKTQPRTRGGGWVITLRGEVSLKSIVSAFCTLNKNFTSATFIVV